MDKYESKCNMVFDIIEHPDNYPSEKLADILSDPETREIYNLISKADSAIEAETEIDVNVEWDKFSEKYSVRRRPSYLWFGSRAASVAAIIGTSIVALAAGIAVTVAVIEHKSDPVVADNVTSISSGVVTPVDSITNRNDTVKGSLVPIMFEDEPLEKIMEVVADMYGVEVKFNSKYAASLHLYYKLDPTLSLNEVVEQLNTFEQINIKQNGNILNID